jgi:hypothetical protein
MGRTMIVTRAGDSLLLITQPDHAQLAGRLMESWMADGFATHPRRASILRAIEQHDNGWRELDAAPIVDTATGRIADFITLDPALRQSVWPRGAVRLAADPWAAALVAQHALHIYARFGGVAAWTPFFDEMERLREKYRTESGRGLDVLQRDYTFLRVADLVSLTFCNRWTSEQHDAGHVIRGDGGARVTIEPDPFAGRSVPLAIRARALPDRQYRDDADARTAWRDAREVALHGEVSGVPTGRATS